MATLLVPLNLTPGAYAVCLRGLCGQDELSVEETNTAQVLAFLEPLILHDSKGNQLHSREIVTADRDRLIAHLYMSLYGSKVESTVTCRDCRQKFDLNFSLADLLAHCIPSSAIKGDDGYYEASPGISFRFPNGEDELAIQGLDTNSAIDLLVERCCAKGVTGANSQEIQARMADMAPLLNQELTAVCPECNCVQQVQFDMQTFFLARIYQERTTLLHEIHCIASTYHWSREEILAIPRNQRKQFAALIQSGN
jgi:hypothetical protein